MTYGMFSVEGNRAISSIIAYHKYHKSSWTVVLQNLRDLADSDYQKFGEAMDTEVRECVYTELGFKEDFYV